MPKTLYFIQVNILWTWIKTGMKASILGTKPFSPWNIHHKYPSVLSVGRMIEEVNEEAAFSPFPLMGTNRVSLRVIACSTEARQLQQRRYSQPLPRWILTAAAPKDDSLRCQYGWHEWESGQFSWQFWYLWSWAGNTDTSCRLFLGCVITFSTCSSNSGTNRLRTN